MGDRKLFDLGISNTMLRGRPHQIKWRLGYDGHQWIVYGGATARHFVAGNKDIFPRIFREEGIDVTPEALARIEAFPDKFLDWAAAGQAAPQPTPCAPLSDTPPEPARQGLPASAPVVPRRPVLGPGQPWPPGVGYGPLPAAIDMPPIPAWLHRTAPAG